MISIDYTKAPRVFNRFQFSQSDESRSKELKSIEIDETFSNRFQSIESDESRSTRLESIDMNESFSNRL